MRKPLPLLALLSLGTAWAADVAPDAKAAPTLEDVSRRLAALEAQQPTRKENELVFFGFAHLTWGTEHDQQTDSSSNQFALGQFDLFVSRNLGEHAAFLGEVVIEGDSDGNTIVDLERAILSYRPYDGLELGAGRYHTHTGWWNVNYHHGEWFQTTIGRPAGLEFEDGGGILPVHLIGLYGEQRLTMPVIDLSLVIEVGNGRGPAPDPPQMTGDANDHKAVNLAISLSPKSFSDLEIGANLMLDRIPEFAGDPDFPAHPALDEQIIGVYGTLQRGPLLASVEFFVVRHENRTDQSSATSRTGYALVGWEFDPPVIGNLTPFARADWLEVSDDDIYFASTDDRTDFHLGIRWDMTSAVAVKLQGTSSTITPTTGEHYHSTGVAIQVSGTY